LELHGQRLETDCIFHPDFRRRPLDRHQKHSEMRFRSTRPNSVAVRWQLDVLGK
jgi:hypothetical protein